MEMFGFIWVTQGSFILSTQPALLPNYRTIVKHNEVGSQYPFYGLYSSLIKTSSLLKFNGQMKKAHIA